MDRIKAEANFCFPDLQETPAQFQERCAQIALKCFWRESGAALVADGTAGDGPFTRVFQQLTGADRRPPELIYGPALG